MTLQSTKSNQRATGGPKIFATPQSQDTVPARRRSGQSDAPKGSLKPVTSAFIGAVLGIICVLAVVLVSQLAFELRVMAILLALAAALVIRATRRNWKR